MIEHAEKAAIAVATETIRDYFDQVQAHDAYFGAMELAYLLLDAIDADPNAPTDVPRAHEIWERWYWNWLRAHSLTASQVRALRKSAQTKDADAD